MKTGAQCVVLTCGLVASALGMLALWADGIRAQPTPEGDTTLQPSGNNAGSSPATNQAAPGVTTPDGSQTPSGSPGANIPAPAAQEAPQSPALAKHAGLDPFKANCVGCHSIGEGKRIGPDLKDVLKRVPSRDWAVHFVKDPSGTNDDYAKKLKGQYPILMTPFANLGDTIINDILDFIDAGGPGLITVKLRQANTGDMALGRKLFSGEVPFASGAPACVSCHTAAGLGFWGGGTLGPDLTKTIERNGGTAGLQAALTSPQFKVMKDVYAATPLTENEVIALSAYLGEVAKADEQPGNGFWFILIAVFGAVDLLLLARVVWVARFDAVRKPMIEQTYSGERS